VQRRLLHILIVLMALSAGSLRAQQWAGEVVGTLSGATHIYHGEYVDDQWGAGTFLSLHYAPLDRLNIEARFGLGDIRWLVSPATLASNPDYFGQGAEYGDPYPGTLTSIERENESRLTTGDLLVNWVLVDGIDAVPFLSAGVGVVNFSPSNAAEHEPLPNNAARIYPTTVFSIPVGGGVRIPFSDRAGIVFRAEHRFVFSDYLDDVATTSGNDGVTSLSIGLTYRFTEPGPRYPDDCWEEVQCDHCGGTWEEPCGVTIHHHCPFCHHHVGNCCGCDDCCGCCCCCCCGGGSGGSGGGGGGEGSGGGGGGAADVGPPPPPARDAFSKDIRFKLDTDEFDFNYPQTKKNLEELKEYMLQAPDGHEVIIEGHASGEGPPKRNQVLSDIRAKKIREWLIENGVDADKIRGTVGYGSSMPKVTEPTPEQMKSMTKEEIESIRAQNRRIDIHILKDAYKKEAEDARKKWEEEKKKAEAAAEKASVSS